ncbi:MAG: DUF3102 domain-containing protein [Planctomycetes bacterium]|nr:DUF3102 domain-containing protein [Planctomycetota bacterium]
MATTITKSKIWKQINAHHEAAEQAARSAINRARECGDLLISAKAECRHGEWGKRLKDHFSGSARTAQAYMKLAKQWPELEAKSATAADLTVRDALKMLAQTKAMLPSADQLDHDDLPDIPAGKYIFARDDDARVAEVRPSNTYPGYTWIVVYDMQASSVEYMKKPILPEYVNEVLAMLRFNSRGVDRWSEAPVEKFDQWYLEDEPWAFREKAELAAA